MRGYRGKRMDTGAWVYGDRVHSQYKIGDTCVGQYGTKVGMHKVDPATVGQNTDFYKMDETEDGDTVCTFIFEGDIVEPVLTVGTHPGFSWGRHVVVFDRGAFCLKDRRGQITPMCNFSTAVEFKVIGNIHDNPDMVEVQE